MAARVVPTRPDLDQYRKQAKDLMKGHASRAPDALQRIQRHHPRLQGQPAPAISQADFKLADAQWVIAREHGFESWPKFSAHVQQATAPEFADSFTECVTTEQGPLQVEVTGCKDAIAIVQFVVAGNVSHHHPGIRQVAEQLNRASLCTVLADLFTEEEDLQDAINEDLRFDIRLLARRAAVVTAWIAEHRRLMNLPIGYLGSGTGAAAAVIAAAELKNSIKAVVSSAGRPDLAGSWLARVQAPILFIVGANDAVGFGFTRAVMPAICRQVPNRLITINGAGQPFEAGNASEQVATHARDWFSQYFVPQPQIGSNHHA